jgi:hypothetical protein
MEVDPIAVAGLGVSTITAIAAIYIGYRTLIHTAKPRIHIFLIEGSRVFCNQESLFNFEFCNRGYWYATPPVINLIVYFNFDPAFHLKELRYGSDQENINNQVMIGKGGMKSLRAHNIDLVHRDWAERAHILAVAPPEPGIYPIRIDAISNNGTNASIEFRVECI